MRSSATPAARRLAFATSLVVTGLEPWSAYSAIGHPGFKHFVRLHVRPDGRLVRQPRRHDHLVGPRPGRGEQGADS